MSKKSEGKLPVEKNEDIEFSKEVADGEDFQASRRAHRADRRQEKKK